MPNVQPQYTYSRCRHKEGPARRYFTSLDKSSGEASPTLLSRADKRLTRVQGEAFSRSIRAAGYLECSAVTGEGIEDVFQAIIRIASQSHALSRF